MISISGCYKWVPIRWTTWWWINQLNRSCVGVQSEWSADLANCVIIEQSDRVPMRMTNKKICFDFLSWLVVNSTSDCVVRGFPAMSSGGKSGIRQKRSTTKVTGGLERQLPWELTQLSVRTPDTKRSVWVIYFRCALSTEEIDFSC